MVSSSLDITPSVAGGEPRSGYIGAVSLTMDETPTADGNDFDLVTWLVIMDEAP